MRSERPQWLASSDSRVRSSAAYGSYARLNSGCAEVDAKMPQCRLRGKRTLNLRFIRSNSAHEVHATGKFPQHLRLLLQNSRTEIVFNNSNLTPQIFQLSGKNYTDCTECQSARAGKWLKDGSGSDPFRVRPCECIRDARVATAALRWCEGQPTINSRVSLDRSNFRRFGIALFGGIRPCAWHRGLPANSRGSARRYVALPHHSTKSAQFSRVKIAVGLVPAAQGVHPGAGDSSESDLKPLQT